MEPLTSSRMVSWAVMVCIQCKVVSGLLWLLSMGPPQAITPMQYSNTSDPDWPLSSAWYDGAPHGRGSHKDALRMSRLADTGEQRHCS